MARAIAGTSAQLKHVTLAKDSINEAGAHPAVCILERVFMSGTMPLKQIRSRPDNTRSLQPS
jgi:hypothetical protein